MADVLWRACGYGWPPWHSALASCLPARPPAYAPLRLALTT